MQAKAMIVSSKRLGMLTSFLSRITCSISIPSKRSNVIKNTLFLLFVSNVLSNSNKRSKVRQRVIFKTSTLKNKSSSSLSSISPNIAPIMGTKASNTYRPQTEDFFFRYPGDEVEILPSTQNRYDKFFLNLLVEYQQIGSYSSCCHPK